MQLPPTVVNGGRQRGHLDLRGQESQNPVAVLLVVIHEHGDTARTSPTGA